MRARSYTFNHAIVRSPSTSIVHGLRAIDTGVPDLGLFQQHHADYVAALESTGANITTLAALDDYPDSVFVEDTALCLPEAAIILRPGAPSRLGEAAAISDALAAAYNDVFTIGGPGFIEGGDILTIEREILIGASSRTNSDGIEELRRIVSNWGYSLRQVATPSGVLHFKTDCALLDEETILCTKRLADSGCFQGYKVIHTADGEEACANSIRFNDHVILPAGFPKTAAKLADIGYNICEIGNSEAAKLDGGMSCLSLRFSTQGRR